MARLLGAIMVAAVALGAAPAAAGESWSAFGQDRRYDDRAYIYFVPGEYGRSGRFVSRDDGYFKRGGGVEVRNGQARFDYDRDYPYYYPSFTVLAEAGEKEWREPSCTVERARDESSGGWTEVRVCRN